MNNPPPYWQQAIDELSHRDPTLQSLILKYSGETLTSKGDDYFTLVRAIVGQQISVKAADAIWKNLEHLIGEISPTRIINTTDDLLREAGLSKQKILYLKNIAYYFLEKNISPSYWTTKSVPEVNQALIAIKGIGAWTSEMFCIFHLLHPDILPLSDVGLIKAIHNHYSPQVLLTKQEIIILAHQWQPWRTVATWYLWRSLDPVSVEY